VKANEFLKQYITLDNKKIGVMFATVVGDKHFGVGISLANAGRDTKRGRLNVEKFDSQIGEALAFKRAVSGEPLLRLKKGKRAKEINEQIDRFWTKRARMFFHDKRPLRALNEN